MSNYDIGYGKPPKHSMFKTGQSGNTKGRPKGRISTARFLEKHMNAKVTVSIGGKPKKVSRREALVMSAIGDAFKGNEKVRRHFLDLVLSFDVQLQTEAIPQVNTAQDQAVIDALLYRYGMKTGAVSTKNEKANGKTIMIKKTDKSS